MKTIACAGLLLLPAWVSAQSFTDGTLRLPLEATQEFTMDVEAFDADGDGDPDLVIASEAKENWILFNDGNGVFSVDSTRRFPLIKDYNHPFIKAEDSEDIAIADFDGDGDPDLLFVTEDTDHHELLFNDGTGRFSLAPVQIPKTLNANAVLVYDFNGDSLPDVLLGHTGQNLLYLNQGQGIFTEDSSGIWPINANFTQDLKLGDVDGDGDLDIVEGIEQGGSNLFINQGTYFEEQTVQRFPTLPLIETRKVVLGDVDGDNDLDIFLCNVGWNTTRDPQDRLLINDGNGFFTDETSERFPYLYDITLDAVFTDLNNDQQPELVVTTDGEISNVHVHYNRFGLPGRFLPEADVFPFFQLNTGVSLYAGDLNGDSLTDFYFGHRQADRLIFQGWPTSTREVSEDSSFRLYPSVTQDVLRLENSTAQKATAVIYDMTGKPHHRQTVDPGMTEISVVNIPAGNYILRIEQTEIRESWHWIKQ